MSTTTVWNITPATKETPTDLRMYGKVIKPGACAKVNDSWVRQYPKPLTSAEQNKSVYVGEALPAWYYEALEDQMKKITHKGQAPSILTGKKFSPTRMKPGASIKVDDAVAENLELDEQPWIVVEEAEASAEADEQKTEELEEKPTKEKPAPKKKRNIRRKKKDTDK